ncbi:cold-shock protein [Flavihumibacter sp. CACIAM 22H1]|uniref:cold-shock protein n=1 Tax=Flavihumibacter sp. CACIAM 22H1 TaxID=1812911 RepID=UPI0007A831D4|nr:cold shock domain-containing protein [Flavihumibacter sp. CACIAM 22H1]KYP14884.1 MAG: DNA-binding protein [Flavihumibacter sp. CACIAM 22H1]
MARSKESFNKKEMEKKRAKKKQEKEERKDERKQEAKKGKSLEDMMAYIDADGNIVSTPPDPSAKVEINVEDIQISVPKQAELSPEDLIRSGVISFMNEAKGFGFIRDLQTQESIFVHVNEMQTRLGENDKVNFEVVSGPKGYSAINVRKMK